MSTAQDLPAVPAAPALRVAPPVDEAPLPGGDLDFDAFVRRYEGRLCRLVHRRLGDQGEAEEITQETLLRAYQHRHSFTAEDELIAWSTVVAQRLVIDRVRVRGRAVAVAEVPETYRVSRDTADIVVARAEARTALESLEAIPERQAAILWAREVEGLHYDDIAERFGITEPAVRSLLHRGRRALRKEYARRGGSLPLGGLIPLAPWLIALKKLDKVRAVARGPLKAVAPAATALALATTAFVGIGGGGGGGKQVPADGFSLSPGRAHHSSYDVDTPRDPELSVRGGSQVVPAGPAAAGPAARPPVRLPKIPGHCVGDTCITSEDKPRGDVLYLGPRDVEYPTGQPGISLLNVVPMCRIVPTTVVTSCEPADPSGSGRSASSRPAGDDLQ